MRLGSFFLSLFLLAALPIGTKAQSSGNIPLGTWRVHLSYNNIHSIADVGDKIYAASESGLFAIDRADNNSITTLTKIDGFSESNIAGLGYNEALKTLLITYKSGNIDLLKNDKIININAITRASILGSKNINHISFYQNLAYLSTDFGLVVLNMARNEIKESNLTLPAPIYASAVYNDSIYVATRAGVRASPLKANLLDNRNFVTPKGLPAQAPRLLATVDGKLYAAINNKGLYRKSTNGWDSTGILAAQTLTSLQTSAGKLIATAPQTVFILDANAAITDSVTDGYIKNPSDALLDQEGKLWIADLNNAVVSNTNNTFQVFRPQGPYSDLVHKLYAYGDKIMAVSGGYDNSYAPFSRALGYYVFDQNGWKNYATPGNTGNFLDIVSAYHNPNNQYTYFASFNEGLLIGKPDNSVQTYNYSNSTLVPSQVTSDTRVSDIAIDMSGNVWVTNFIASGALGLPSVHKLNTNGQWQSFNFPQYRNMIYPIGILIDDNNNKWVRIAPNRSNDGAIMVFNENNGRSRLLTVPVGANAQNINVNAMVKDKDGAIWVGTDAGVGVYYSPGSVFNNTSFLPATPIVNGRPLLEKDQISAIAIDGGNRKWIATKNNGIWLFDKDAGEALAYYNTKNSPLLSDNIIDVAVNGTTGEVFIATDKGIVSFRSTATEAEPVYADVKIFPNPVRPGFNGLVGISGLAANVNVKITDVSGKLVYETRAQGGTATWNTFDYKGHKAETGIYLVFSSNDDGSETYVGKIAVVE